MSVKELFKSNIPRSLWVLLLYVLYAIAGTMGEYLFKDALNAITAKNFQGYIFWQAVALGMELASAIILPIATVAFTRQIQNYLHEIRKEIMQHYYESDDEKVSTMQNELTGNLKMLTTDFATPLITIFSGLLEIAFAVGILASMSWILIVVTAVLAVITLLIPKILEKQTAKAADAVNQKNEKLLNTIEYWLGGLQELRRYSALGRLQRQLAQASSDYVAANKKSFRYRAGSYLLNGLGNSLSQIAIGLVAGVLFIFHIISFGDFVVATSFAFTIFGGIWQITGAVTQVKASKKLREQTFALRQKITNHDRRQDAYGVKVENLCVTYDHGETITYPDFTIKPGQKVLLSGDSGTGKSTLFKLLLGKLKPEHGQITFLDKDGQAIAAGQAKLGNLPQDPIVFPVSIKDNITMFNAKLQDQVQAIAEKVQLAPDLAKMPAGADTIVDLKNENLSGGQRQKVVLARSEIHQQPFVLMDEVTSAIDQQATEKILDNLLQTNQTVLMIAHNFTSEMRAKFDQEIKLAAKKEEVKHEL